MTATDPIHDEKAGFSSMCRRGDVAMCLAAGASCTNPKHGAKQARRPEPQKPKEAPVMPEPRQHAKPTIGIVWEEPPEVEAGQRTALRDRLSDVLDECRERPGEWARIATYPRRQSAHSAANSLKKRPPAGKWEFVSRRLPGDGAGLYARFVK